MDNLFLTVFLLSPIIWVYGLIKPSSFEKLALNNPTRKQVSAIMASVLLSSFVGFGLTVGPPTETKTVPSMAQTTKPLGKTSEATPTQVTNNTSVPKATAQVSSLTDKKTPKPLPTYQSTSAPTTAPTPYIAPSTPIPTQTTSYSVYTCNCSKTCTQISSCAEAMYQLNVCGCSRRDGDHDGIPCESLCK